VNASKKENESVNFLEMDFEDNLSLRHKLRMISNGTTGLLSITQTHSSSNKFKATINNGEVLQEVEQHSKLHKQQPTLS